MFEVKKWGMNIKNLHLFSNLHISTQLRGIYNLSKEKKVCIHTVWRVQRNILTKKIKVKIHKFEEVLVSIGVV